MTNLRPVLLLGLVFLAYMMWVQWQKDYATPPAPGSNVTSSADTGNAVTPAAIPGNDAIPAQDLPQTPTDAAQSAPAVADSASAQVDSKQLITIRSDVLELQIDPTGATPVRSRLLAYPVDLDAPEVKVELLSDLPNRLFVAQSGLLSQQDAPNHTSEFVASGKDYELSDGQDQLTIPMRWTSASGIEVTKTFTVYRGRYDIDVDFEVTNNTSVAWTGSRYDQLQRNVVGDEESGGFTNPERYSFFGIGFYDPEEKFTKIDFEDAGEDPYQKTNQQGWLAMIQHYFFAAWIPRVEQNVTYSTLQVSNNGQPRYIARAVEPVQQIQPGQSGLFDSTLFVGPKLQDTIPEVAPGLEYTVNYGIFTVFSKPLYWLLAKIHTYVGNWGWSIVLLTILIKLAFFKLTEAQYRSTARMRKLQPRIEQLKERYGDDRQRMSQAMMELYKTEKVNPLGGCLPILVQIPIFIALYWVLLESVELRQAPFILWIENLSVRDPYFILPALNAIFMFATQKLTPMVGMDPLQQKMMQMMPVIFSIMFAFFPAGLVLYWATNAGLSLAQQYYITRKIAAEN